MLINSAAMPRRLTAPNAWRSSTGTCITATARRTSSGATAERDVLLDARDAALSRHRRGQRDAASTTPSSTCRCAPATAGWSSARRSRWAILPRIEAYRPDLIIISAGLRRACARSAGEPQPGRDRLRLGHGAADGPRRPSMPAGGSCRVLEGGYDLEGLSPLGCSACHDADAGAMSAQQRLSPPAARCRRSRCRSRRARHRSAASRRD